MARPLAGLKSQPVAFRLWWRYCAGSVKSTEPFFVLYSSFVLNIINQKVPLSEGLFDFDLIEFRLLAQLFLYLGRPLPFQLQLRRRSRLRLVRRHLA